MVGSSERELYEHEIVEIAAISGTTITLTSALTKFHYGAAAAITTAKGDIDMRAPVGHLSRNI